MLESELFGHEKGAFTGAVNQRKGRFELASGGTLFLDEIGEVSTSFQAKLLRVLQEGEFERVGGTRTIKVDVRLVCATNRDLEAEVAKGAFRADLYFRLAVVPIFLPPLRERRDDISPLASEFLSRFNHEHGTQLSLTPAAFAMLESCYFPGNVRELENCIRHTATLARSKVLADADFPCQNDGCLSALLWKGVRAETALGAAGVVGAPPTPISAAPPQTQPSARHARRGQGKVGPGDGEGRLGASEGGPHPWRDAAPSRLRIAQAPHRFEEVLNPMSPEETYRWLIDGVDDSFDVHVVASILALSRRQAAAEGRSIGETAGFDGRPAVLLAMFPHASALFETAGTAPRDEDELCLLDLLRRGATTGSQLEDLLAGMIARRAQRPNHLWQDLGLRNRGELSALMMRHFAPLARRNRSDMKWKKFFFRTDLPRRRLRALLCAELRRMLRLRRLLQRGDGRVPACPYPPRRRSARLISRRKPDMSGLRHRPRKDFRKAGAMRRFCWRRCCSALATYSVGGDHALGLSRQ